MSKYWGFCLRLVCKLGNLFGLIIKDLNKVNILG